MSAWDCGGAAGENGGPRPPPRVVRPGPAGSWGRREGEPRGWHEERPVLWAGVAGAVRSRAQPPVPSSPLPSHLPGHTGRCGGTGTAEVERPARLRPCPEGCQARIEGA